MPIYTFKCNNENCSATEKELIAKIDEEVVCECCGEVMERVFSPSGKFSTQKLKIFMRGVSGHAFDGSVG
jgi:predicted nucleic acid-binding Zn ribbon protein